jgi:hypothetical protein
MLNKCVQHTSVCPFATMLVALFFCNNSRAAENSDSVAREGTTDTTKSEAKCAIRATVTRQISMFLCTIAADVCRAGVS